MFSTASQTSEISTTSEDDNTYLALDKYVFVQSDLGDQAQVQAHANFLLTNITLV